jgi:hypothetical protein
MRIQYPELFEKRLATSKNMRSAVDGTVTAFDAWLRDSKLPFFTDYTDHGSEHLNHVMLTAAALIPPEAREKFTAEDTAVLILAILLHDSALHLSEAGFQSLIKGNTAKNCIEGIDTTTWPDLWDEYLFSAKRWDDQKLKEVFGSDDTGAPLGMVRDPFEGYANLTDTDRKLIGEFIRQHHPRLAHEFAVFGVPSPSSDAIKPAADFDSLLCDLAGLVARSHGRQIRTCVDYLSWKKYPIREFQNVHAVYLMALLRVADYLQVDADRTSNVVFKYKHIPSKFSEREHKTHLAVKSITRATEDPEAIHVTAQPEDVHTFLRLKNWLAGIQTELDQSWAALGEVYGRYAAEGLNKLGLSLRRIKSNLDDVENFAKGVGYVPQHITLDVARADLLKLLIGPLYGGDPGVGVRELMQNAVDAVRELTAFTHRHEAHKNFVTIQQDADVEISLESPDSKGHSWLVVTDKGIGMTEEVIRNYFLKAGASFRATDAWKKEFEIDGAIKSNATGIRSRVLRSGRFGVGALAAFLLGEEIHVSTRHVSASKGIKFITKLDLDPVELRYDKSMPVGTSVRVKLSHQAFKRLSDSDLSSRASWDWYCLDSPVVSRKVPGKTLEQGCMIKTQDLQPASAWRRINPSGYEAVYWAYGNGPSLICNGIRVGSSYGSGDLWKNESYTISQPKVCVFDPDGVLPLDLQRAHLSAEKFPFKDLLFEDVSRDILAFLLVNTPDNGSLQEILKMPKHRGYSLSKQAGRDFELQPWVVTDEGICPFTSWNLWRLEFRRLLLFTRYGRSYRFEVLGDATKTVGAETASLMFDLNGNAQSKRRFLIEWVRDAPDKQLLSGYGIQGTRLITSARFGKHIFEVTTYPQSLRRILGKKQEHGNWTFLEDYNCPDTLFQTTGLADAKGRDDEFTPPMSVELFLKKRDKEPETNTFEQLWKETIDYPVIPFDLAKRRSQLAKAYEVLTPFIKAHEADKAETGKKAAPESDQAE